MYDVFLSLTASLILSETLPFKINRCIFVHKTEHAYFLTNASHSKCKNFLKTAIQENSLILMEAFGKF